MRKTILKLEQNLKNIKFMPFDLIRYRISQNLP